MAKNAQSVDETDYVGGLTNYNRPKTIEPLRSRPKDDADEAVVERLHNLPEGYGRSKEQDIDPAATTSFRARIALKTQQEMAAHKKSQIGLTYAAMIEEMWKYYKRENDI
jgi:hypothetical protein